LNDVFDGLLEGRFVLGYEEGVGFGADEINAAED
jgi:hypothetical protein